MGRHSLCEWRPRFSKQLRINMENLRFYWLVLGILCVWRITHLLNAEDGPWEVVFLVRRKVGSGFWGKLLDCFYCLSLWIAAPIAAMVGYRWKERILLWLAFSAGAILLERVTNHEPDLQPGNYSEEKEDENGLLR